MRGVQAGRGHLRSEVRSQGPCLTWHRKGFACAGGATPRLLVFCSLRARGRRCRRPRADEGTQGCPQLRHSGGPPRWGLCKSCDKKWKKTERERECVCVKNSTVQITPIGGHQDQSLSPVTLKQTFLCDVKPRSSLEPMPFGIVAFSNAS